ncbi:MULTISPECIES: hypothetical protein [Clostridium]|uniref:Uncharacterized protein n=1 Tax=Clostridium aquiflavi TaxID=3073603 RepID=A0ABU1EHM5_9CLOT|nr:MULTISPECIES: hypothetical protein [unclassified Clostridium]MDR5587892.1 hypothetical protein [Clostridium sp. 5N-1]NFG61083.1 hypothetical protein [Clostridium botulinum]NFQ09331.1 hypothetical protein [Clostridium botulinum]
MNDIIFKTVDGVVYAGKVTYFGKEELSVKNLNILNEFEEKDVPALKENVYEDGDVWFYTNKIIWYKNRR